MRRWFNSRAGRWGVVIVWMALIFTLSAQSQLPGPGDRLLDFVFEKTAHITEYAILAFLWLRALSANGAAVRRAHDAAGPRSLFLALFLTGVYALSDEFHQSFVPGRSAGWSDVACDWLGSLVGLWVWARRGWRNTIRNRV